MKSILVRSLIRSIRSCTDCSDKNIHRKRLEARDTIVTWDEVLARNYQVWESERIQIDTAYFSIEESFQELVKKLTDIS